MWCGGVVCGPLLPTTLSQLPPRPCQRPENLPQGVQGPLPCHSWWSVFMRLHPGSPSSSGCAEGVWGRLRLERETSSAFGRVHLQLGTDRKDPCPAPHAAPQGPDPAHQTAPAASPRQTSKHSWCRSGGRLAAGWWFDSTSPGFKQVIMI